MKTSPSLAGQCPDAVSMVYWCDFPGCNFAVKLSTSLYLNDLALTSKSMYALAERFLYRTLHLSVYTPNIASLLESKKYIANVQRISFRPQKAYSLHNQPAYTRVFELLADFLPKFQRLKRLQYVHT